MSPSEYNQAQMADRREIRFRNIRAYLPWVGAFAGGGLLVSWCVLEWVWFFRG